MIGFLPKCRCWQKCPFRSKFCHMGKRVLLIGFDGADGLDLFGPAEVFYGAGRRAGAQLYSVVVAAVGGGAIALSSGVSVAARDLGAIRPQPEDTVLVVGGEDRALDKAA